MNYSVESLYDVIESVLVSEMDKNIMWEIERANIIVSYVNEKKHIDWVYNDEVECICPIYVTPFGGLIVDVSMIVQMDLKIKSNSIEEHLDVCEKLATMFVENNMSELDRFFYDELKSGRLKLKWRM
jgi:hypothetical protein